MFGDMMGMFEKGGAELLPRHKLYCKLRLPTSHYWNINIIGTVAELLYPFPFPPGQLLDI